VTKPIDDDDDESEDEGDALATHGDAEAFVAWLLAPLDVGEFERDCVDRKVVVSRASELKRARKFRSWFGLRDVEALVRTGACAYGIDVDVTRYVDGTRETVNHNGVRGGECEGGNDIVDGDVAMRRFTSEGCSIRVLHPQTRHDGMWKVCSTMETFWRCASGCNVYATPPNSQGFAPHYDDIDAFVCQIEGEKHWRVYEPFEDQTHPRVSSKNFTQEEIARQRVLFDGVLRAGDVLYMPRGAIHQAECSNASWSVHATLSTNQFNTPADLLELVVADALTEFIDDDAAARRTFSRDFGREESQCAFARLHALGNAFKARATFDWQHAIDRLGARLMLQRLPPPETHLARSKSESGDAAARTLAPGQNQRVTLQLAGAQCLCVKGDRLAVCHIFDNARDASHRFVAAADAATTSTKGEALFDLDDAPFVQALLEAAEDQVLDVVEFARDARDESGAEVFTNDPDDDSPGGGRDYYFDVARSLVAVGVLAVVAHRGGARSK